MLSAADYVNLRAVQETIMTTTCTIRRRNLEADGRGGYTEGLPTDVETICRISPFGHRSAVSDALVGAQLSELTPFMISLPYDTDLQPTDLILIDGEEFAVQGLMNDHTHMTAVRVIATRME